MPALVGGAVVVGAVGKQTAGRGVVREQPPEDRRELRRDVPAQARHVVRVGGRQPHAAPPLPVLVGVRIIQPEQRPQHRPQVLQVIDLHLVQQIGDVRIGRVDQILGLLRQPVERLVDDLHRIGPHHALRDALPHRRQIMLGSPALSLRPLEPVRRGNPAPRLRARHVRMLRERLHDLGRRLYDAPVRRR